MAEKGFFKELTSLVKKHFFENKAANANQSDDVKVASVHHDSSKIKDADKQTEIQRLCQQLIKKQDMLTSGRLQFIGLSQVKRRLGKSWEGLKPLVYKTVDDVLKEYMGPHDLFVRYKEDNYIIIFATASIEEAEIKTALIAEEIRRRMFETEQQDLQELHIEREVRAIKTESLAGSSNIIETIGTMFSSEAKAEDRTIRSWRPSEQQDQAARKAAEQARQKAETYNKDHKSDKGVEPLDVKVIEVDAYKSHLRQHAAKDLGDKIEYIFMPIWDVKRLALTTYICMIKTYDTGLYPFRAHKDVFNNLPHSKSTRYDLKVLQRVIDELQEMQKDGRTLFVCCPVHYETLVRNSSFQEYEVLCQKIPEDMRKFVFFLVFNLPESLHRSSLSGFVGPLKNFCRYVCVEVPFSTNVDFETLRVAGVDSAGLNISTITGNKSVIDQKLKQFVEKAKKNFIPFVFILGVSDTKFVTSAVVSYFDFVGGPAIHTHVKKPDKVYKFRYDDLYRGIVQRTNKTD